MAAALVLSPLMTAMTSPPEEDSPTRILTTFFPIYLFTLNLTHDIPGLQVDILLPADYGCPHDFSLAPEDIRKIHQADIIVTNGLGLDDFLLDIKSAARTAKVITATSQVTPLPLRSYHKHEGHSGEELNQYNPHPFASPHQVPIMVRQIASSLASLIPEQAERIDANRDAYLSRLNSLDKTFSEKL